MRKDEIRAFAGKWFDLFDDRGTAGEQLADPSFETECLKFGFKMDLGESMMREYPDIHVFDNWQELDGIIDEITDENFLGTAIHSKWRAVRRHGDEHLADELNREWFLIALGRLRYLATSADDQRLLFYGTPRKVRVISNNVSFGHPPKPDDEVEQHVTICRDGRTYLSSFVYGDGKNFKLDSNQAFNLKPEEAQALLDKIAEYFSGEHSDAVVTDVGDWDMEITNTEGAVFKEWGSLVPEVGIFNEFSDMVRRTLGRPNLLVLDGEAVIRPIDRITIEYHRVSTVKPPKVPEGTAVDHITWEYSEHLILDRKTDTIEHVQDVGTECQVLRRYHVAEGVSSFLDNCSPEDIFANVMGNASDATTDPAEEKTYTITVLFGDGSSRKAEGTFDKRGLPDDYGGFAEAVWSFMSFYGFGEMFDPALYYKVRRRPGELIYCSVCFEDGGKTYWYRTEDDSLSIGDLVVVTGKEGETVARIEDMDCFEPDKVPFPIPRTGLILRRYEEEPPQQAE